MEIEDGQFLNFEVLIQFYLEQQQQIEEIKKDFEVIYNPHKLLQEKNRTILNPIKLK